MPQRLHGGLRAGTDLAADRDAIDGGDDLVVPAQDRGRLGVEQVERRGDHLDRQWTGQIATDLGTATGREGGDQRPCGVLDACREPRGHLRLVECRRERVAVPAVLRAIEREHARPDDLRRGEARIVDGEAISVAHDLDAQVPPRDQPAAEDGQPRDRLDRTELREQLVRPPGERVERDGRAEPGRRRRRWGSPRALIRHPP